MSLKVVAVMPAGAERKENSKHKEIPQGKVNTCANNLLEMNANRNTLMANELTERRPTGSRRGCKTVNLGTAVQPAFNL